MADAGRRPARRPRPAAAHRLARPHGPSPTLRSSRADASQLVRCARALLASVRRAVGGLEQRVYGLGDRLATRLHGYGFYSARHGRRRGARASSDSSRASSLRRLRSRAASSSRPSSSSTVKPPRFVAPASRSVLTRCRSPSTSICSTVPSWITPRRRLGCVRDARRLLADTLSSRGPTRH